GDVLRRLGIDLRLGLLRPFLGLGQPLFKLSNTGEVFVELVAVIAAQRRLQLFGLVADHIEDALAVAQPASLRLHLIGPSFEEQPRKNARWPGIRRHWRARPGPRQAKPFTREDQAGIAGLTAQMVGCELIQRDRVTEASPPLRMRRGGQEAVIRIVAGTDLWVRESGDDRE